MLMRALLLITLALALLAGCGDDGGSGGSGGNGSDTKLAGQLTFNRGGGIDGRRDTLVVQPDGQATLTLRQGQKKLRLKQAELAKLQAEVAGTDLGAIPPDSTSEDPVPDTFGYRVSYRGDTVNTDDPAMPDELRGLVGELGAIVDRYGRG